MLFERLSIENYGVYADKSVFDLSTTVKKPIILIGGLNGAGKTTIFESLMIALYGKIYLGRKTTQKKYMQFIIEKMHTHEGVRASNASIEIVFRFYHNGSEDEYIVNRSWFREGLSVSESLQIQKNKQLMNDVDESQWQTFIEGLIPIGIAHLFFFDGEKIVNMMKWSDPKNDEIKSSLDALLGTEIINRLHSDLELYLMRRIDKTGDTNKETMLEYDKLNKEKEEKASDIELLTNEAATKDSDLQKLLSQVSIFESKIADIGGGYADIRGMLLTQKARLEEKILHQKKTIHEELGGDAPFYLVPAMMDKIKDRLELDTSIVNQKTSTSIVKDMVDNLYDELFYETIHDNKIDTSDMYIQTLTRLDISSQTLTRLENMFGESSDTAFFDVAPKDTTLMLEKITTIKDGCKSLQTKIKEHKDVLTSLETIESNLAKVPHDDELGPQISKINETHQEIGILKSEISHIEQQISSHKAHQKILQNKLKSLIDSIHKHKKHDAGAKLAINMQQALKTYSNNLKTRKIKELESNMLNAINSLLHKKHIHRVDVDSQTFDLKIYANNDDENSTILKSMGERQMVGTALLWAIAKTSRRSLPFVIDTPVGRLDGKHFSNLVDRFYPFASHQLILLSTDREIGLDEYAELSKYTSHSYQITCDESKSTTTVTDGYFKERDTIA